MKSNIKWRAIILGAMITASTSITASASIISSTNNIEVVVKEIVRRNYPINYSYVLSEQGIVFNEDMGKPVVLDGRTYVPLKILGNELGLDIKYNSTTAATEVLSEGKFIELFNGNHKAKIDGVWTPLDVRNGKIIEETTVKIINGRTYVPIRFMSETLGLGVDVKDGIIFINKAKPLVRMHDMEIGQVYKASSVVPYPNPQYQPGWKRSYAGTWGVPEEEFDYEDYNYVKYGAEELKTGVNISQDVKIYGISIKDKILYGELSHPVNPCTSIYETHDWFFHEEPRGYSASTYKIEKLSNGNFKVPLFDFSNERYDYSSITHVAIRIPHGRDNYIPSGANAVVISLENAK